MGRKSRFSEEVRERAVRLVLEHESEHASRWAAIVSVAGKIGCAPESLRKWVVQKARDAGKGPGLTMGERERMKELEREVRELRRAGEHPDHGRLSRLSRLEGHATHHHAHALYAHSVCSRDETRARAE